MTTTDRLVYGACFDGWDDVRGNYPAAVAGDLGADNADGSGDRLDAVAERFGLTREAVLEVIRPLAWADLAEVACRAYDRMTGWQGPVRIDLEEAVSDVRAHATDVAAAGGFVRCLIIRPDPESVGACVNLKNSTVWTEDGTRSVRWK